MSTPKDQDTNWIADEDGPLPYLMKVLQHDNRQLVQQILLRDPWQKDNSNDPAAEINIHTDFLSTNLNFPAVHWRQALVFAEESLQNIVLRQVMGDTGSWNSQTAATIKKKKKNKQPLDDMDQAPIPKQFGIVATHILSLSHVHANSTETLHTSTDSSGASHGMDTRVSDSGAEVVLQPGAFSDQMSSLLLPRTDKVEQMLQSASLQQQAAPPLDVILYFLRPDPAHIHIIAKQIQHYHQIHLSHNTKHPLFHKLLFLPNYTSLCEQILIQKQLLSPSSSSSSSSKTSSTVATSSGSGNGNGSGSSIPTLSIHDLPIDLIPFDKDILSLEMPNVMKEAYVDQCPSSTLMSISRSMLRLQDIMGTLSKIQGVGLLAEQLIKKMMDMRRDEYLWEEEEKESNGGSGGDEEEDPVSSAQGEENSGFGNVEGMIILDRKIDMVTPMLSPLTYEGLMDEILGMDCGFVTVDASLVVPDSEEDENSSTHTGSSASNKNRPKEKVALALNGSDALYAEVRNQNVEKFGSFLQNQAKALKESHSNFTNKDKDLTEIHQFVKQIPIFTKNLQSLTQHIHLAERIKQTTNESSFRSRWQTERAMLEGDPCYDILEDLIAGEEPPWKLLRLLVLQSLTSGGLKGGKYDYLRKEIVQTYGFEYLFLLTNFEKIGLLRRQELSFISSTSPFAKLRQGLNLIHSEVNTVEPEDIAYVSSGYAPLTVRIIQALVGGKSKEVMKELPGRIVGVKQGIVPLKYNDSLEKNVSWAVVNTEQTKKQKKKSVLIVFYVGGVTFMEIAALRFLSKSENFPYEIVCCATKIINGTSFLRSLN